MTRYLLFALLLLTTPTHAQQTLVRYPGGTHNGNGTIRVSNITLVPADPTNPPVFDVKDGQLKVMGDNVTLEGIEVMSSERRPEDRGRFSVFGNNVSIIRCHLHHLKTGLGHWDQAAGGVIEGNHIHDCGVEGSNKYHGLYINGTDKLVRHNVIRNVVGGYGLHLWAEGSQSLEDITVEHNVVTDCTQPVVFTHSDRRTDGNVFRSNIVNAGGHLLWIDDDVKQYLNVVE